MTFSTVMTFSTLTCGSCGVVFGLSNAFIEDRREDHKTWYCPNGCARHYPQETDEEKLRRMLNNSQARVTHLADQLEAEKRSKSAIKGHMTRMRRRISNGVCPWCQRHFANVESHVHNQHPEHVVRLEEVMSNG